MEKLFYNDFYQKEFDAKVISTTKVNDKYEIILDQTLFYPEGGGQKGDKGWLNGITVEDTYYKSSNIIHLTNKPLELDMIVHGKIDWNFRYRNMQSHSGEHIISGIIKDIYGYTNTGFRLDETVSIDYSGKIPYEDIPSIEYKCNKIIQQNLPINIDIFNDSSSCPYEFRSKKEINEGLRVVRINNVDYCACCGTHVHTTSEIGLIHFISHQYYKGGTRLEIVIGDKALEYISSIEDRLNNVSKILSSPKTDIIEYINNIKENLKISEFEIINLKRKLADLYSKNIKQIGTLYYIDLFDLGSTFIPYIANKFNYDNLLIISGNNFFLRYSDENKDKILSLKNNKLILGGGKDNYINGIIKMPFNEFIDYLR